MSPDGSKVASWARFAAAPREVFVHDLATNTRRVVHEADVPVRSWRPEFPWSPNGEWLLIEYALPPADELSLLRRQYEALGFLCDRHPMVLFAGRLRGRGVTKARELHRHVGRRVRVAGWLIAGKLVPTKKGEPMEFLTFEDETGLVETTFFPDAYRRFAPFVDRGRPYLLSGTVDVNWGAATLTVDDLAPVAEFILSSLSKRMSETLTDSAVTVPEKSRTDTSPLTDSATSRHPA